MTSRALLILSGCLITAGCGITDPYDPRRAQPAHTAISSRTSTTTTTADAGDPAPERGGTIPQDAQAAQRSLAIDAGAATPAAALERFARLDTNWHASTLIARQRQLATISLGQARGAALQAAAGAQRDTELTRSHVTNRGQVIAITPGQGPAAGRWVVVTTETTTGQGDYTGLPDALHVTYAQVTHITAGWVVSQWSPQN